MIGWSETSVAAAFTAYFERMARAVVLQAVPETFANPNTMF
jgi:hypothetical protein